MHSYLVFHWVNPDITVLTGLEFTHCSRCEFDGESESGPLKRSASGRYICCEKIEDCAHVHV